MLYPGGSVNHVYRPGFDIWSNYLCDLLESVAQNGMPNPWGAAVGRLALLLAVTGILVPLWLGTPRLAPSTGWLQGVRVLGLCSVAHVLLLMLIPITGIAVLHEVAVFGAALPGLVAASGLSVALGHHGGAARWLGYAGALAIATASVDALLYAALLQGWTVFAVAAPALQKVALVSILIWLGGAGRALSRFGGSDDGRE